MELLISERLKKHRKERKLTQEALAGILGISPQSISKWECGDGYPDITLLPALANYFGITIDELVGNDEISAKSDIETNFFGVLHLVNDDERLNLALRYHKKYPRDFHIAAVLMHEITRNHRDRIAEYEQYLYSLCERILEECFDSVIRRDAIKSICMICEESKIADWLNRDTAFWHEEKDEVYEERYELMGDMEQYWIYKHADNLLHMSRMLSKLLFSRSYQGAPENAIIWNEQYIGLLDAASARTEGKDIPDGWLSEYASAYMRLAAAHFGRGDKEAGYKHLEEAVALGEKFDKIPDGTSLSLGNELFYGKTKAIKSSEEILLPNGKRLMHYCGISEFSPSLKETMEAKSGWEWLDSVRGEERFLVNLKRAKGLL